MSVFERLNGCQFDRHRGKGFGTLISILAPPLASHARCAHDPSIAKGGGLPVTSQCEVSRRALLAGAVAAGAMGAAPAFAAERPLVGKAGPDFVLANVLLETGYDRQAGEVVGTRTTKVSVLVRGGVIARIMAAGDALPAGVVVRDGGGLLLLPSFRDMHIHLDKTFYGGPWIPPRLRRHGIVGQIERERTMLPQMLPTLQDRADKLVTLLQGNGTTFARSQCNVDPVVGTRHVELLKAVLDRRADSFGHEIVAFPQHGFLSAHLEQTMCRAMEAGATHVGGIDPTTIDGGMERSVDTMLQIAVDYTKSVDIHLHEPGASGIAAIRRIADAVERTPALRGRVTISHAFSLMSLPDPDMMELAARMASLGMSVASAVPFGGQVMPIPTLLRQGVAVYTGTDSVIDHWSVFGTGDVLEKAKLACQLYGWTDELGIAQSLRLATGGPMPLNAAGEQVWPKPGDPADMVLVAASCSAEAVARLAPRHAVFYRGVLAAGGLPGADHPAGTLRTG
jgi:cytosine/adenosine deaminase-related metal-dependent hydrolase